MSDIYLNDVVLLLRPSDDAVDGSTNIVDSSPVGRTINRYGNTQIDTSRGYPTILFDGSGDYMTCSSASMLMSGLFTLEVKAVVTGTPVDYPGIISRRYNYNSSHSWTLCVYKAGAAFYFNWGGSSGGSSGAGGYVFAPGYTIGTEHHISVTGTATQLIFHQDGVYLGSVDRPTFYTGGSQNINIGRLDADDTSNVFQGHLRIRFTANVARYLAQDYIVPDFDTDGPLRVASSLEQLWGDVPTISRAIDQYWGIKTGADLQQHWGDAAVVKGQLVQPWSNAGVIRGELVQRWRDMVTLRAMLDQPWAVMESLLVALEQPWAITSGPVQTLLDQGWNIRDIEPVLAALHQPWTIASDGTVLRYTVEVMADRQPVRVSHVNIEGGLELDGDVLTCEIHPETEWEYLLCPFGAELTVAITSQEGTDTFVFVVTSPSPDKAHGNTQYVVEAASPAVLLGAPYAEGIEEELTGLASELAATLVGDLVLSWETVDWHIPAATWIASGETPLALLKTLAAAVGAVVQSDPDGTLAIRPRYPISVNKWQDAPPDLILTETLDCFSSGETPNYRSGVNRYLVSNQSASADSLRLEETEISSTIKEVRCYQVPWEGTAQLSHTGGSWINIEDLGIEERQETETVEFVAGAGQADYPVYGLVSIDWQANNLGTITPSEAGALQAAGDGQSLCEITYTTKCRLWQVTDPRAEQLQLVVEI